MHVPGLKVVTASTPYDAKGLLKSAIRDDSPVIFLEHALLYSMRGEVSEDEYTLPIGRADIKRAGDDITIIAYLRMVHVALNAAEVLVKSGISAEVIDLRTLRPMDIGTIVESVKKTKHAIIVEEDWPQCGIGAQVVDQLQFHAFDYLDAPIMRVTLADTPMPYSRELEQSALPNIDKVVATVSSMLEGTAAIPAASI